MQEFQLRVIPTDNNNFALELYQCAYKKAGEKKRPAAELISYIKGNNLNLIKNPNAKVHTFYRKNQEFKQQSYFKQLVLFLIQNVLRKLLQELVQ